MKIYLSHKAIIGLCLSLFILLLSAVASFYSLQKLIEKNQRQELTQTIILKLENINSIIKEAEAVQRGYLITGDTTYLNNLDDYLREAMLTISHVKQLTSDNILQQKNTDILGQLVDQRFEKLQYNVSLRRKNEPITSKGLMEGMKLMHEIRTLIKAMQKEEQLYHNARMEENKIFIIITPLFIIAATLTAIIISLYSVFTVNNDLRKRLVAEDRLYHSEAQLLQAQDIAHIGNFEWDLIKHTFSSSLQMHKIFGWREREVNMGYEAFKTSIHPEDLPVVERILQESIRDQAAYEIEYRIIRTDRTERFILSKGRIVTNYHNTAVKMVGIVLDITDRKHYETDLRNANDLLSTQLVEIKKAEEEVRTREAQLSEAQAAANMGSYEWDVDKDFVYWSDEMYRLFGYKPKEIFLDFEAFLKHVHPDDFEKVKTIFTETYKSGGAASFIHRILTRDGTIKYIRSTAKTFKDVEHQSGKVAGIAMDITEQVRFEQILLKSEEKFRLLAENSTDVISKCYADGTYIYISPSCTALYGYDPEELVNRSFFDFIHQDDKPSIIAGVQELLSIRQAVIFIMRYLRKDGEYIWIEVNARPIQDTVTGEITEIQLASRNITERKIAEEALHNRTLALEASNKELEAFSYSVSHDLRSPLRAIDGFGRKLSLQYEHVLDSEGQKLLSIIRSSTKQMGLLIDSLLEFSRLNKREISRQKVHMRDLVDNVIQQWKLQNPESTIKFKIGTVKDAIGDKVLLLQVWDNLISNAIKFSGKKENPVIEVGCIDKSGETTYYVKDNGAGFDMRYMDKLFGVFQRLHSAREFEGTGVGLALVQRIVMRHEGNVWAESEVDKGATFYFSLPKK